MSDQPKPATGEWTEATVRNIAGRQLRAAIGDDLVADAHNAELAAEREQLRLANINACESEARANDAEAARDDEAKLIRQLSDDVLKLEKQLAAERTATLYCDVHGTELQRESCNHVRTCEQCLSAERESRKD